jgi:hypothetical protein
LNSESVGRGDQAPVAFAVLGFKTDTTLALADDLAARTCQLQDPIITSSGRGEVLRVGGEAAVVPGVGPAGVMPGDAIGAAFNRDRDGFALFEIDEVFATRQSQTMGVVTLDEVWPRL